MSYLVLARKYRPKNFDSLVGQDHVVRALSHALDSKRLHHAYLFTGTRGIGKTTLSRILAKSLNCEKGITSQPCGECDACTAIDADRFVDYIEMDAASNRGIADMLQLLEQAVYAPSSARFKVYMIDEVHMLTAQAFNAMLKTLEEPPEYIKFILATTDPQKIPVTVLSRCLQFNLKQMPPAHIVNHLEHILGEEKITSEKAALRLLAQGAQGSMRDALSLADQAIAYTAGNITLQSVQDMLGALDQTYLVRLLDNLAKKDGAGLLAIADEMTVRSLSYDAALQDLGLLLHRIALAQSTPAAVPEDIPEHEDVLRLANLFSEEEVQLFYQIAVHGRNELGLAPDQYVGFSMTLLRMLAFRPALNEKNTQLLSPEAPKSSVAHAKRTQEVPIKPAGSAGPKLPQSTIVQKEQKASQDDIPPWLDDEPLNAIAEAVQEQKEKPSLPSEKRVKSEPPLEKSVAKQAWNGDWPALAAVLPVRGVVQQLAQQTELVRFEESSTGIHFHFRVPIETLCTSNNVNRLVTALTDYLQMPVKVTSEIGKVQATANENTLRERAERQSQAEAAVNNDAYVQNLISEFNAKIVPGSIKSI